MAHTIATALVDPSKPNTNHQYFYMLFRLMESERKQVQLNEAFEARARPRPKPPTSGRVNDCFYIWYADNGAYKVGQSSWHYGFNRVAQYEKRVGLSAIWCIRFHVPDGVVLERAAQAHGQCHISGKSASQLTRASEVRIYTDSELLRVVKFAKRLSWCTDYKIFDCESSGVDTLQRVLAYMDTV